jgi:hypothetical protein
MYSGVAKLTRHQRGSSPCLGRGKPDQAFLAPRLVLHPIRRQPGSLKGAAVFFWPEKATWADDDVETAVEVTSTSTYKSRCNHSPRSPKVSTAPVSDTDAQTISPTSCTGPGQDSRRVVDEFVSPLSIAYRVQFRTHTREPNKGSSLSVITSVAVSFADTVQFGYYTSTSRPRYSAH